MKIYRSTLFERNYKRLPEPIKDLAEKKEVIFRKEPFDPRLKTHKLSGIFEGYWGFWINQKYRIIFKFKKKDTAWFYSVGDHDIYKRK